MRILVAIVGLVLCAIAGSITELSWRGLGAVVIGELGMLFWAFAMLK